MCNTFTVRLKKDNKPGWFLDIFIAFGDNVNPQILFSKTNITLKQKCFAQKK